MAKHVTRAFLGSSVLSLLPFAAPAALAQYKDYPQVAANSYAFAASPLPYWLALDFEARGRSEGQTTMNYVQGVGEGYELTRARGGLAVKPLNWATGYIQFQDSHALFLPLPENASNMRDAFDIRQAYVSLHAKHAQAIAGRQEMRFGGERLIGASDWSNVGRTFDGFSARIGGKDRVEMFSTSVVAIHPTAMDMHAGGLTFHGVYATINSALPHTTVEPYVLIKRLPSVKGQQGTLGTETEVTPGMRVLGNLPSHFDYLAEGALQRGSYANDSIHSGAGYFKLGYTAPLRWQPRLQGEYDYATGNPHRNALRVGTFDQLYPSSHNVFGIFDLFGWQNIRQTRVNLDLKPSKKLTVQVQQEFLNVASVYDSVYSGSGSVTVKAPTAGFSSDDLGKGVDASARYVLHRYIAVQGGFSHFFPGKLMMANKHGASQNVGYLTVTYRGTLSRHGKD